MPSSARAAPPAASSGAAAGYRRAPPRSPRRRQALPLHSRHRAGEVRGGLPARQRREDRLERGAGARGSLSEGLATGCVMVHGIGAPRVEFGAVPRPHLGVGQALPGALRQFDEAGNPRAAARRGRGRRRSPRPWRPHAAAASARFRPAPSAAGAGREARRGHAGAPPPARPGAILRMTAADQRVPGSVPR